MSRLDQDTLQFMVRMFKPKPQYRGNPQCGIIKLPNSFPIYNLKPKVINFKMILNKEKQEVPTFKKL